MGEVHDTLRGDDADVIAPVLASDTFRRAPSLRSLLKYLWEHRHDDLNEFSIAIDALDKRPDFDPKIDATVRVQILRLRQKLKEFYGKEGAHTRFRLLLPTGSHRIQIEAVDPTVHPQHLLSRWLTWTVAGTIVVTTVLLLAAQRYHSTSTSAEMSSPLPPFWKSFAENGKPVRVVIPNLAFFRWPDNTIKVRDTRVNSFDGIEKSAELNEFVERWGRPELMVNYTSAPDAYAAGSLVAYLASHGVTVTVIGHREAAVDSPGAYNRILIGNAHTVSHLSPLLEGRNFEPLSDFSFRNRQPHATEPSVFAMVIESRRRETVPGLICRLRTGDAQTLILMSENSPSLAQLITTLQGLAAITELAGENVVTEPFELLSVAVVEGGRVAEIKPRAFRKIM